MNASEEYISDIEKEFEKFCDDYLKTDEEIEKYCKEKNIRLKDEE